MKTALASTLSTILLAAGLTTSSAVSDESAYTTERDISYLDDAAKATDYQKQRCHLDVYHPTAMKGFATLVWFHGGALQNGERHIPAGLKNRGIAVVPVNYRLHPKVNSPAYVQDAAAAVAWTFRNIGRFGGDPDKIFVSGHSAGGYLTSMVGLDQRWLAECGIDADRIAGLIPLSGQTITHSTVRKERGISETRPLVDDMAPLYHIRADAPPILMITGGREIELNGRYEENVYLWRMLKVVGHKDVTLYEIEGYGHGMVSPAIDPALNWMRKHGAESVTP